MATYEKHGAQGSMVLNHDWTEDSQGRNEYFKNCVTIEADPKDDSFVVMRIKDGKHDFWKGREIPKEERITIKALDLIALIKKDGKII